MTEQAKDTPSTPCKAQQRSTLSSSDTFSSTPNKKGGKPLSTLATPKQRGFHRCMSDTCSVCLSPLDERKTVIMTKCKHTFHDSCLHDVKENKSQCPMCRTALTPLPGRASLADTLQAVQSSIVTRNSVTQAAARGRNAVREAMLRRQQQERLQEELAREAEAEIDLSSPLANIIEEDTTIES